MSSQLVRELQELIEALDRRVPHVGRPGEALIAIDAAALKVEATKQIADLEGIQCTVVEKSTPVR